MTPMVALQVWQHRRIILGAAVLLVALLMGLVMVIGGIFVSTPLIPPETLERYRSIAASQPVEVSWQEMVALDAVRLHQGWERAIPAYIASTAEQFFACRTVRLPDGKNPRECEPFSLEEVMRRLKLQPLEQEQVRQMLVTLRAGVTPGAGGCAAVPPGSSSYGYVWPVVGPITECFGMRQSPEMPGEFEMHWGVDIGAPGGTPVQAATAGEVTFTGRAGNYGNLVILKGSDGLVTFYAHLSSFASERGAVVQAGDVIGYVGSTGRSFGTHLHLETRPEGGNPVDPFQYFR